MRNLYSSEQKPFAQLIRADLRLSLPAPSWSALVLSHHKPLALSSQSHRPKPSGPRLTHPMRLCVQLFSHVQLFVTPRAVTLSMGPGSSLHGILQARTLESEVAQSCLTLCHPWTSPPSSSVHGILQARILEWVAISFSKNTEVVVISSTKGSSPHRARTHVSYISYIAGGFLTA